jgi:exo-beta-1,3-glucanase (GH17 family)
MVWPKLCEGEMSKSFLRSIVTTMTLLTAAGASEAAVNGINYDPAHSAAFQNAQSSNNLQAMKDSINADLAQLKKIGFGTIKTFYSTFCTYSGSCVPIAQLAQPLGIKVLLGVYEFQPSNGCNDEPTCISWKTAQVDAALSSVRNNSGTVIGIVVGNEDMFDWQGNPQPNMQQRIANDIQKINNNLNTGQNVIVTSAQRQGDWTRLNTSDPAGVLGKINTIGANIYPFWGNSPEKQPGGASVAYLIQGQANALGVTLGKKVIITEEGWPSCGANANTQDRNIASEINYFTAWRDRLDTADSYYFAAYDNKDPQSANCASTGDANNYFGLCTQTGTTKDPQLCDCSGATSCSAPLASRINLQNVRNSFRGALFGGLPIR